MEDKFNLKKPQVKKLNQLMLLAALGIALIMVAGVFTGKNLGQELPSPAPQLNTQEKGIPTAGAPSDQVNTEEKLLEAKLTETLGMIEGAGLVDVTVRLGGTTQQEYAEEKSVNTKSNQEKDDRGGTRTSLEKNENGKLVVIRGEGSGDIPVVKQAVRPEIQGILVVAEGARDLETREVLTEAVTTLLELPANKVRVVPRKNP